MSKETKKIKKQACDKQLIHVYKGFGNTAVYVLSIDSRFMI